MASLLKILGLSMWLYLASQGSITVCALLVNGTLQIDGSSPIGTTDEDFICATMDWWPSNKCDYGTCSWGNASLLNIDLNNTILLNAIKAFSPLKLRLGGTLQDKLVYQTTNDSTPCHEFANSSSELFGFTQGCLPMARWDDLNNFFKLAGAKVIFGLNALRGRRIGSDGTARGAWDYSNAEYIIRHTVNHNYTIHGWELGNELSGFGVGTNVSVDQYVSDLIKLRQLVQHIYNNCVTQPLVLGPGGFFDPSWFSKFVNRTANNLQVVTHHIYNLGPGVDDNLTNKILNATYLERKAQTFSNLQSILKSSGMSTVAWVGEAGGAYNSGRNELSGRGVGARVLADQYASDVINLQELVRDIYNDYDKHPLVLAPGGYYNEDWYTDFLLDSAYFVQVVTHHIYNLGPGVDEHLIDKILNTSFLDQEAKVFSNLQTLLKNIETPVVDAWVGEAGGAYNSGRDLVSNAFVFSFWYLDQLGMSASYDTKTYCRQSLIGGNYGLLDTNTFVPNPDYYSALLWHRLMGTNVLSTSFTGPKNIRAYAHCSKISTGVTLLLINLDKSTAVQVVLSIKHGMHQKKTPASKHKQHTKYENIRDEYHLTAKGGNLQSRIMLLNGEEISLSSSGKIPPLEPKRVNDSEPITVAPLSILFARIPSIELPACK